MMIIFCTGVKGMGSVTEQKPEKMKYLALGDSYTICEGLKPSDRWPVQLVRNLKKYGLLFDHPQIIAKTGWTTDELAAQLEKDSIHASYDLVSLLIGVNNQYRGRSLQNYREEFVALLLKAIGYASGVPGNVIVISIPDYGVTPFASERNPRKISSELDQFNAANKEIAAEYAVQYVDITPVSRLTKADSTMLATDQLHPSAKMYSRWVDLINPVVINIFNKSDDQR